MQKHDILLKFILMIEEHGQLLLIFTNFAIGGVFRKIFTRIFFRECFLLTSFAEFYFHGKEKKTANFAKINLTNN